MDIEFFGLGWETKPNQNFWSGFLQTISKKRKDMYKV